jgi:hypothetical protein
MYIKRLEFGRTARSGKCEACGKRTWSHGRAVVVQLWLRLMPGDDWLRLIFCKRCLGTWLTKLS